MKILRKISKPFLTCMRMTLTQALLAVVCTTLVMAKDLSGQEILDKTLSLSAENQEIKAILSKIEKAADVRFTYSPKLIKMDRKVNLNVTNERLSDVLQNLLKPLNISFEAIGRQIILSKTKTELRELNRLQGGFYGPQTADRNLRGTITDGENGTALAGVSIVVKRSNRGVTTDAQGNYQLSVPEGDVTLVFSFIGYASQEVRLGTRSVLDIRLVASTSVLSEVVVVGYGTQKKSSVTGAISQVSSKDMAALPVVDARQALQGRVAGVSVVNNGSPGEEPVVRIRGIGSINYASNPLYVVDGLPTGGLGNFDGRDIESVEVLKDAAAAAIYGSRAANGVIMITTKKAKNDGKLHVNLDSYYGTQTAWRQLDLLNRDEYIKYGTALRQNAGQALPARFGKLNDPIYVGSSQTYAQTDTDLQKEMFRTAPLTQTNVSISSGNDKSRLFASAGYFKQDGIMLGTTYERFNFRFNSDHTLGKVFTFGQTFTISNDYKLNENNGGGRTQIKHIIAGVPYIPVLDPTQLGGYRGPSGDDGSDPQNPVRLALQDLARNNGMRILGTAFLEAKIMDGLRYKFLAGIDYGSGVYQGNFPIYNESFNARALNRVEQSRSSGVSRYFSNQLFYDKTFGNHYLNLTAVAERQTGSGSSLFGGGTYPTNSLSQVTNSLQDQGLNGGLGEDVLLSYLGRVNYEYAGKYLFSASFRRDGSSVFAPGKQWGNFPSVSVGWRLSEEAFMKQIPSVSELKIRASYGLMGFNGIPNYAWQPVLSQSTAPIFGDGRQQGTFFNFLGNTELGWEITKMTNIGIDLGMFSNRFTFQAEYFDRITDGLILNLPLSPSLGFSQNTPANVGSMKNSGIELQAGYRQNGRAFRWDVSGNFSIIRNKVLSFGENIKSPIFSGDNADFGGFTLTRTQVGDPVQAFFGWQTDGIFQSEAEIKRADALDNDDKTKYQDNAKPGDIRFRDINGDGKIDADDRTVLGSFIPSFSYGLNFSMSYKNFDATVFLQGVQGNQIYNGTKVLRQGMLRLFGAGKEVLNAWTPSNTNTDVPRAVDGDPNNNSRTSERFLESGSYLRVKNLSVGYTIPEVGLKQITNGALSKVRVYVSTANLLTITKYTGYDPEIGSRFGGTLTNGIDYGQFPAARTVLVGLQVSF